MKTNYHKTKGGKVISISELETSHLENIIAYIEKRAKQGVKVVSGGGGSCAEDMWADVDYYYGKTAKNLLNYNSYVKELEKRKLL